MSLSLMRPVALRFGTLMSSKWCLIYACYPTKISYNYKCNSLYLKPAAVSFFIFVKKNGTIKQTFTVHRKRLAACGLGLSFFLFFGGSDHPEKSKSEAAAIITQTVCISDTR